MKPLKNRATAEYKNETPNSDKKYRIFSPTMRRLETGAMSEHENRDDYMND